VKCKCGAEMVFYEGEDEKSDGRMMDYAYWSCPSCDAIVHDYDDEFEYPEDDGLHMEEH
jgi:hypothetical protein